MFNCCEALLLCIFALSISSVFAKDLPIPTLRSSLPSAEASASKWATKSVQCVCDSSASAFCRSDNTCNTHEVAEQLLTIIDRLDDNSIFRRKRQAPPPPPRVPPGISVPVQTPPPGLVIPSDGNRPPPGFPTVPPIPNLPTLPSLPPRTPGGGGFSLNNIFTDDGECDKALNGTYKDLLLSAFQIDWEPSCVFYPNSKTGACSFAPVNETEQSKQTLTALRTESFLLWDCALTEEDNVFFTSDAEYCNEEKCNVAQVAATEAPVKDNGATTITYSSILTVVVVLLGTFVIID